MPLYLRATCIYHQIQMFFHVYMYICMVEPPNKGHFGNGPFVLSSEVVPIAEVHHIFISNMFKLLRMKLKGSVCMW